MKVKITRNQLKKIIAEEIEFFYDSSHALLNEQVPPQIITALQNVAAHPRTIAAMNWLSQNTPKFKQANSYGVW